MFVSPVQLTSGLQYPKFLVSSRDCSALPTLSEGHPSGHVTTACVQVKQANPSPPATGDVEHWLDLKIQERHKEFCALQRDHRARARQVKRLDQEIKEREKDILARRQEMTRIEENVRVLERACHSWQGLMNSNPP